MEMDNHEEGGMLLRVSGCLNNFVVSIIMMTKKQCLSYTKKTYAIIKRTIYTEESLQK